MQLLPLLIKVFNIILDVCRFENLKLFQADFSSISKPVEVFLQVKAVTLQTVFRVFFFSEQIQKFLQQRL